MFCAVLLQILNEGSKRNAYPPHLCISIIMMYIDILILAIHLYGRMPAQLFAVQAQRLFRAQWLRINHMGLLLIITIV